MRKYFAYIRVSTVKQGERGSSLQEQKSAIEAYAARNNLSITGWFEEMETAAKQGRREFSRMMTALNAHKADGIIIHKIDRSARNLRDWANLGDLIDSGIDVRFVTDNFDLLSRGGRLSADIQAVVAADFIRNLREEVKKGMYGRLKQGIYPWKAPIGYLNMGKGNAKAVDPVKGPLVRLMFERYATNTVGFHALRREMYERGLRTQGGKILPVNTIHLILNNPFYIGVLRVRAAETYQGIHEPLISKTLFERVQQILRGRTVPRSRKHLFLFRQMVKCERCGRRTITGETHKGYRYYRCHSHSCRGFSWREDALEGVALDNIRRIRFTDGDVGTWGRVQTHADHGDVGDIRDFRDVVADIRKERTGDEERLKASLKLRLQHVDDRITRLTDLLVDSAIDRDTYNARREKLLIDRQGITGELDRAQGRSPLDELFDEFESNNRQLLRYESLLDDEKRELVDIICSNFSVNEKSSTFTLRTPYKEIAELHTSTECEKNRNDVRIRGVVGILKKVVDEGIRTGNVIHLVLPYPSASP